MNQTKACFIPEQFRAERSLQKQRFAHSKSYTPHHTILKKAIIIVCFRSNETPARTFPVFLPVALVQPEPSASRSLSTPSLLNAFWLHLMSSPLLRTFTSFVDNSNPCSKIHQTGTMRIYVRVLPHNHAFRSCNSVIKGTSLKRIDHSRAVNQAGYRCSLDLKILSSFCLCDSNTL